MTRKITHIDSVRLASGIQSILLDMKKTGIKEPRFPVARFEEMIQEQHLVSKAEAERVTEKVINTGILRWELFANNFIL